MPSNKNNIKMHVHQSCFSRRSENGGDAIKHEMPEEWIDSSRAWRDVCDNNGWEYKLWSAAEYRDFIRQHYEWFLPVFDGYEYDAMRCDSARYFLMYHYGGIYADLDIEPVGGRFAAFLALFEGDPSASVILSRGEGDRVANSIMICREAHHPLWRNVIRYLMIGHPEQRQHPDCMRMLGTKMVERPSWKRALMKMRYFHIMFGTGTGLLTEVVEDTRPRGVRLLPKELLQPCESPSVSRNESLSPNEEDRSLLVRASAGANKREQKLRLWPEVEHWWNKHGKDVGLIFLSITTVSLIIVVSVMAVAVRSSSASLTTRRRVGAQ